MNLQTLLDLFPDVINEHGLLGCGASLVWAVAIGMVLLVIKTSVRQTMLDRAERHRPTFDYPEYKRPLPRRA
jgi:hypothetical protein